MPSLPLPLPSLLPPSLLPSLLPPLHHHQWLGLRLRMVQWMGQCVGLCRHLCLWRVALLPSLPPPLRVSALVWMVVSAVRLWMRVMWTRRMVGGMAGAMVWM